jgi:hypothetical protein
MKLLLSNNRLTRFSNEGNYATVTDVPLQDDIALVAQNLLAWLNSQLGEAESVNQVFLEPDGQAVTTYETQLDLEGNEMEVPAGYRPRLNASVTVDHSSGSRTFAVSSEALPSEMRDSILSAWEMVREFRAEEGTT